MKKYGELVLQKQAAYLFFALEMSPIKMLMKLTPDGSMGLMFVFLLL
jgi:hypothetical protein